MPLVVESGRELGVIASLLAASGLLLSLVQCVLLVFLDFMLVRRPVCPLCACFVGLVTCSHRCAVVVSSMSPIFVVVVFLRFSTLAHVLTKARILVLRGMTDVSSIAVRRSGLESLHYSRVKQVVSLDPHHIGGIDIPV